MFCFVETKSLYVGQVWARPRASLLGKPVPARAAPTGGGSGNYRPGRDAGDVDLSTGHFRTAGHKGQLGSCFFFLFSQNNLASPRSAIDTGYV